ncbi:MAG: SGNH/GDSL hydrolase family protein [Candidatus Methylacidiphilales bacterium]|nr:GDSL-type esterase/lipase family protein [Candidatus Methylacidiphilales bacterium]
MLFTTGGWNTARALDPVVPTANVLASPPYPSKPLLRPTDRVIFIGDSITGQGANVGNGWRHLIQKGLALASAENKQTLISLGGSGQTVGSWSNVEKRSREKEQILDVKGVDVKAELDQPADVVIFMLGMNDALSPSMADTPEAADKWMQTYSELIKSVRSRCNPRVVAIGTPTLCTEDIRTPKNVFLNQLSQRIETLAKEQGYYVLPTRDLMSKVLNLGRAVRPDFHVTTDFVHPNPAGHYAIAAGMLRGLGEMKAVEALKADQEPVLLQKNATDGLSYTVTGGFPPPGTMEPGEAERTAYAQPAYYVNVWHLGSPGSSDSNGPDITLEAPEGMTAKRILLSEKEKSEIQSASDRFPARYEVRGTPDRMETVLTASLVRNPDNVPPARVVIQAPWLVGIAPNPGPHWVAGKLDPAKASQQPADALFSAGSNFPLHDQAQQINGRPASWYKYTASVNWDGENRPGSLDMAALHFYQVFYVAYGLRWYYSETDRPVEVLTSPLGFVNNNYLSLWMNGEKLCDGVPLKKGDKVTTSLKKGWNALVFRSDHSTWLWAFSLDLRGINGDELKDVRVSISASHAAGPPSTK